MMMRYIINSFYAIFQLRDENAFYQTFKFINMIEMKQFIHDF